MSEPWPPAFIRTAPPIEPGTPTAHSKPVSPAAAVRRASTGRATPPPAVTTAAVARLAVRRQLDVAGQVGDGDGDAGEAVVGDEQVRAPADDEHGQPGRAAGRGDRGAGRRAVAARTNSAAGPPTRYVVSGPSGSSRVGDRARGSRPRGSTAPADGRATRRRHRRPSGAAPGGRGPRRAAWRCRRSPSRCTRRPGRPRRRGTTRRRRAAAATRRGPWGWASSTASTTSSPGDAGDRRRARRVDVGEHDDVGVDEGVGVLPPHLGDAVEAVRLERDDDPPPAVAAVAGGGDDGGDLGRQVGVVVDERGPAVDAADVEAAGDAAEAGQGGGAVVERHAEVSRHGDRAEGVDDVVHAAQRQGDVAERRVRRRRARRRSGTTRRRRGRRRRGRRRRRRARRSPSPWRTARSAANGSSSAHDLRAGDLAR